MFRRQCIAALVVGLGCQQSTWVSSPSASDGVSGPDAGRADAGASGSSVAVVPLAELEPGVVLGAPCVTSAQCDDGLDCTVDVCDTEKSICQFTSDNARCSDGQYCNGVELCVARLGCRAGPPTSCSDATPCTVDRCDEATRSCVHIPRDVDGDGDPDGNCSGGADCDDQDPGVSSLFPDVCSNGVDDNCSGVADEAECQDARYDRCDDALRIEGDGVYLLNPAGAGRDMVSSCFAIGDQSGRDLVFEIIVPDGPPQNLDVVARSVGARLALDNAKNCEGSQTTGACAAGATLASGLGVARLRLPLVPAGSRMLSVLTDIGAPIELEVSHSPGVALESPGTCASPRLAPLGQPFVVSVETAEARPGADAGPPEGALPSECEGMINPQVYAFELPEVADVRVLTESVNGLGEPRVSLRDTQCESLSAELLCREGGTSAMTVRRLAAGSYRLAVSAEGPSDVQVVIDVRPAEAAPLADRCETAPARSPNRTVELDFDSHIDDIDVGCVPGAVDAAVGLTLDAPSDLLVVGRLSARDVGALTIAPLACAAGTQLACTIGANRPIRLARRGLVAGNYSLVVESRLGLPATLLAAVRPAAALTLVPGANGCADAVTIPATGGVFEGNTLNASAEFTASCDFASSIQAPEQLLRLTLEEPRRVIFDARGSDFDTLLNLRRGSTCPGIEVDDGCSLSSGGVESFLDLNLEPGDYYLQVDGYAGASGRWQLDAFVLEIDA